MKNKYSLHIAFLSVLLLTILVNCKKDSVKVALTVTLAAVTNITSNSATTGGDVTSDGGSSVTAKGVCWGTNQNPTTSDSKINSGTGAGSFTSSLTGLNSGTTYYIRAFATNSVETAYSSQATFTTVALAPALTTTNITAITSTSATGGGNITADGGSAITARGVCWSTAQSPTTSNSKTTDGTGSGTFTSSVTGLTAGTTYYLRAYATNGIATSYGNEISFTPGGTTVTDIDGNVYHYITIGTQVWMIENLKTTKYRNGDAIANVTVNASWATLVTGGYCWFNNDAATYKAAYGALYNWYAVADSRNIAPAGWHVPTDAEWTTLSDFLGGTGVAGGKLKETGTLHWLAPNTDATNSTGFTALPGNYRNYGNGSFNGVGYYGYWWSSTAYDGSNAWNFFLGNLNSTVHRDYFSKQDGFSIRCIRD